MHHLYQRCLSLNKAERPASEAVAAGEETPEEKKNNMTLPTKSDVDHIIKIYY